MKRNIDAAGLRTVSCGYENNARKILSDNRACILLILLVCFIPRVLCTLNIDPFVYRHDELSTISVVTMLTGQDWSEVVQRVGAYYGGGFFILFAPLFCFIKDTIVIYQIIQICLCLVQALSGVVCFHILNKYFKVQDRVFGILLSILASYTVTRRSDNLTNESILYLLSWISFWIILMLIEYEGEKKKKIVSSVLYAVLSAYAITVHERGLIFLGMILVVYLVCLFVYRSQILHLPAFFLVYAGGFLLARWFKTILISFNFSIAPGSAVKNSQLNIPVFELFKTREGIVAFLKTLFGPYFSAGVVTGGIMIIGSIVFLRVFFRGVFRRKELISGDNEIRTDKKLFVGLLFFFSGIAAMVLYGAAIWLPQVISALRADPAEAYYGLKALTYIRYFGIFLGPVVVLTILWLLRNKKKILSTGLLSIAVSAASCAFWVFYIVPSIRYSRAAREAFEPFGGLALEAAEGGFLVYTIAAIIMMVMTVLIVLLFARGKNRIAISFLLALSMYSYIYLSCVFDYDQMNRERFSVDTYHMLNATGILSELDEVYVYGEDGCTYQYLMPDITIHVAIPDMELEEGMLIASEQSLFTEYLENGWRLIDYNGPETFAQNVFVKGDRLISALEDADVRLIDYPSCHLSYSGEGFDYVLNNDNGTIEYIQKKAQDIDAGTYRITLRISDPLSQFAEAADVSSNPLVTITDSSGILVCRQYAVKDEGVWYADVSLRGGVAQAVLSVSFLQEKAGAVLDSLKIDKTRNYYDVLLGDPDQKEITDIIAGDQDHKNIIYLENSGLGQIETEFLQKIFPDHSISYANEKAIQKAKDSYVIVPKNGPWMVLTDTYALLYKGKQSVLLQPSEWKNKNHEIPAMTTERVLYAETLSSGRYEITFPNLPENVKDSETIPCQLYTGINAKFRMEFDLHKTQDSYSAVFDLPGTMSSWYPVLILDGKKIPVYDFEVKQLASEAELYCQSNYGPLISRSVQIGADEVTLYYDTEKISVELQQDYCSEYSANALPVSFVRYKSAEQVLSDPAEVMIVPKKEINATFKYMETHTILDVTGDYMLLVRSTEENADALSTSDKISDGMKLDTRYFVNRSNQIKGIGVPYGEYEVTILADRDISVPEGGIEIELYGGKTFLTSQKLKKDLKENDEFVLTFGRLESSVNMELSLPAGYEDSMHIATLNRLSPVYIADFEECEIENGTYDKSTGTVTGENRVRISTPEYAVYAGNRYIWSVTFKGEAKSAVIMSLNFGARVNIRSRTVEDLGDGLYRMDLVVTLSSERFHDTTVFEAEFEDRFEIIRLECFKEAKG